MAKRRYGFDEPKIERFHKEGRGLGHGSSYKPWLTIQDVPSTGRSSRPYGFKTGREHHLLSDIETAAFHLFNWSDAVTDIREQFPLDRELTRKIAADMGVPHPKDRHSQVDIVMTTDLLIDARRDGVLAELPRAVKSYADLDDRRTLEKLEIERRYWAIKQRDWRLITEQECPKQRVKNLQWMHEMYSLDGLAAPHASYWDDRCQQLLNALRQLRGMAIETVFKQLEQTKGFAPGEALTALRHLLAIKTVAMDLDKPFRASAPISALTIAGAATAHRSVA